MSAFAALTAASAVAASCWPGPDDAGPPRRLARWAGARARAAAADPGRVITLPELRARVLAGGELDAQAPAALLEALEQARPGRRGSRPWSRGGPSRNPPRRGSAAATG